MFCVRLDCERGRGEDVKVVSLDGGLWAMAVGEHEVTSVTSCSSIGKGYRTGGGHVIMEAARAATMHNYCIWMCE